MSAIVIQAIPFCYGPAIVALRLANALLSIGHDVVTLATGSAAELFELSGLPFRRYSDASEAAAQAVGADMVCSICDPTAYGLWSSLNSRKVYLDFLYFMPSPLAAPSEANADLYLIEKYPGVEEAISSRPWRPTHPLLIQPLIATPSLAPSPPSLLRRVLLTFGGTESPLTTVGLNTTYPTLMARAVQAALDLVLPGAELQVAASRAACDLLRSAGVQCSLLTPMGHKEFLMAISASDLVIAHPGLYTVFETVIRKRPLVLLPPSNYTQVIQLDHYERVGLVARGLSWDRILGAKDGSIPRNLEETAGVACVLDAIAACERRAGSVRTLVAALAGSLRAVRQDLPGVLARQQESLVDYGGDGLLDAVAGVLSLLRNPLTC